MERNCLFIISSAIDYRYIAAQYNKHDIAYNIHPQFVLSGELWGVFCDLIVQDWPRYIDNALLYLPCHRMWPPSRRESRAWCQWYLVCRDRWRRRSWWRYPVEIWQWRHMRTMVSLITSNSAHFVQIDTKHLTTLLMSLCEENPPESIGFPWKRTSEA